MVTWKTQSLIITTTVYIVVERNLSFLFGEEAFFVSRLYATYVTQVSYKVHVAILNQCTRYTRIICVLCQMLVRTRSPKSAATQRTLHLSDFVLLVLIYRQFSIAFQSRVHLSEDVTRLKAERHRCLIAGLWNFIAFQASIAVKLPAVDRATIDRWWDDAGCS